MSQAGGAPPTVHSLHVLAEHVLGAGLYAVTGRIGLAVAAGGFGTPVRAADALGGQWVVAGGLVMVTGADGTPRSSPITTVRAAADFLGVEPGMPVGVYVAATELELDTSLPVDPDVAEQVGDWLALADEALARFAERHQELAPSGRTLWPEHFDLGLAMTEVNYGASPGDDALAEPYLYVGPWAPRSGPFWNQPFGAAVPASAIGSVDDAVAFFEHGRVRAAAGE